MTEYDRRPDFMRDLGDLLKASRNAIADYTPNAQITEPDGGVQFPDGIGVGGDGHGTNLLIGVTPPTPGTVDVVVGANENVVYADASWLPPDGYGSDQVIEYEVELAKVTDVEYQELYPETYGSASTAMTTKRQETLISVDRVSERTIRLEPLEPVTDYVVRIRAVNNIGFVSTVSAEAYFTTGKDDTIPVQVTGLVIGAGLRTITAFWNDNPDPDVRDGNGAYELQIALDAAFTSGLRTARSSGSIASIGDLSPATTYHVRVRAIDASGNAGEWSSAGTATTIKADTVDISDDAITAPLIAAGTIQADSAIIADGAITNAKIGDAQITSAKILNLAASKITTGTLSSTTITVGSNGIIRTGTSSNGVDITADGITLRQSGSIKAQLPNSGNAYFEGSIFASSITGSTVTGGILQTASSSGRVRLSGQSSSERARAVFYNSSGTEVGSIGNRSGTSAYSNMIIESSGNVVLNNVGGGSLQQLSCGRINTNSALWFTPDGSVRAMVNLSAVYNPMISSNYGNSSSSPSTNVSLVASGAATPEGRTMNGDFTSYVAHRAASYATGTSVRANKNDIEQLGDLESLQEVIKAAAYAYNYSAVGQNRDRKNRGIMVDEAAHELLFPTDGGEGPDTTGIELYAMVSTLWSAVRGLASLVPGAPTIPNYTPARKPTR